MTIKDYISIISDLNEDAVLYAKQIDDKFSADSEVVLLELSEKELELKTAEVSKLKCPGFKYFLEVFIIKEVLQGFDKYNPKGNLGEKTDRVLYYAEFDA